MEAISIAPFRDAAGWSPALALVLALLGAPVGAYAQQPAGSDRSADAAPAAGAAAARPSPDYVVGIRDILAITVWNQPTLSGKFNVDADGMFAFPLLGRVPASGATTRAIEGEVARRLADGFLAQPEVSVSVEEFRSQRIFVVGEVRQPGPYPITGRTTLIEILAMVRSTTGEASKEAIIVHAGPGGARGATLPTADRDTNVTRVDLEALQTGDLTQNVELRDGDTVFVPRAETVVVFGQVRNPGVYPISGKTTVVELLAHAGGVTDRGAGNRIRIVRVTNGKKQELKAKLDDVVKAGDTIIIPERLF